MPNLGPFLSWVQHPRSCVCETQLTLSRLYLNLSKKGNFTSWLKCNSLPYRSFLCLLLLRSPPPFHCVLGSSFIHSFIRPMNTLNWCLSPSKLEGNIICLCLSLYHLWIYLINSEQFFFTKWIKALINLITAATSTWIESKILFLEIIYQY